MCARCDAYGDSLPARNARELCAILALVRAAEAANDLEWLDGDGRARLDAGAAVFAPGGYQGAPCCLRWLCSGCSRLFLLELGSRQLTGDGWRPLYGN